MRRGPRNPAATKRKAHIIAGAIINGHSDHSALKKAGYSDGVASSGLNRIFAKSPMLGEAVKAELDRWLKTGQCIPSAEDRMNLIRQRLIMNLLQGKDKAVQSAKLLGQDREVNMFEPEVRIGMAIAVTPPGEWQSRYVSSDSAEEAATDDQSKD